MDDPATEPASRLEPLLRRVDAFAAFVRRRTGDRELADEVVQESLARALAAASTLRDDQRLVPWFWQIVRNAMHDALARRGRLQELADVPDAQVAAPDAVCACLAAAIDALPERQRLAIRLVEYDGREPDDAAGILGISAGNLKVIRHRGRIALRRRLEQLCRACAGRACRDCDCT